MQIPFIWWKDRENQSSRSSDNLSQVKKKKKLQTVKYIARCASLPSGLNDRNAKLSYWVKWTNLYRGQSSYNHPNNCLHNVITTELYPCTRCGHTFINVIINNIFCYDCHWLHDNQLILAAFCRFRNWLLSLFVLAKNGMHYGSVSACIN